MLAYAPTPLCVYYNVENSVKGVDWEWNRFSLEDNSFRPTG